MAIFGNFQNDLIFRILATFFDLGGQSVSLSICARVCGRRYFRFFYGYFIISFWRVCLRDQIFRVL